jgi:propionyl-CoA synthetase
VLGVHDDLKGQVPIGLVVLKAEAESRDEELVSDLVQMVRKQMGATACLKQVVVVERLPRTRSGKILPGTMRRIADGQEYRIPSTIDDADILGEIEAAVGTIGYGRK